MKAIVTTLILSCIAWSSSIAAETVELQATGGRVARTTNMGDLIELDLTPASSRDLSEFTRRQLGRQIDILVGKSVVSSPRIMDQFLYLGEPLQVPIPAGATPAENKDKIDKLVSGASTLELRSRDGQ